MLKLKKRVKIEQSPIHPNGEWKIKFKPLGGTKIWKVLYAKSLDDALELVKILQDVTDVSKTTYKIVYE